MAGLGSRVVHCCLFIVLLDGLEMTCLLLFVHVDGLLSDH